MEETKEVLQKPYGAIYYVLNVLDGKCYIGQTTQKVSDRWNQHKYLTTYTKKNVHFYNAIRKYGEGNFEVRTLLFVYSKEDLNAAESYFISFFNSTNHSVGYNSKEGGYNGKCGEQTRLRISASTKGRSKKSRGWSEEKRRKAKGRNKGRKLSLQTCINISKSKKGKKLTPDHIAKRSASQKGLKRSVESIANVVAGRKAARERRERERLEKLTPAETGA